MPDHTQFSRMRGEPGAKGRILAVSVFLSASIVFLVIAIAVNSLLRTQEVSSGGPQPLETCIDSVFAKLRIENMDVVLFRQLSEACYGTMHYQGLIQDFHIRRFKFMQQYYAENIILWMVVIITLSGVVLAGIQLIASYKLATIGRDGFSQRTELIAEKDKISLKSSYVGIAILMLSFAFFYVYVFEVYRIREVDIDRNQRGRPVASEQQLPTGGLLTPDEAGPQGSRPGVQRQENTPGVNTPPAD